MTLILMQNLTKLAARDMARRRAARESKQLPTPSTASTSPRSSYSISSAARRPFSFFSTSSKKGSLLGLDNSWIGKKDTDVGEVSIITSKCTYHLANNDCSYQCLGLALKGSNI